MADRGVVVVFGGGTLAGDLFDAASAAGYRAVIVQDLDGVRQDGAQADIAIEACVADRHHKHDALAAFGSVLGPNAVLLADALPDTVAECAVWSGHARRCVGYGVVGHLDDQRVVEIARGAHTDVDAVERSAAFFADLGHETRAIGDRPGLISGRTLAALANEAAWVVGAGVASAEDVDRAMRLGTNYPRGPLAWAREIGVRRIVDILENVCRHEGAAYAPAPLLLEMAGLASGENLT